MQKPARRRSAVLVLHTGKWLFSEFLRIAWKDDQQVIAETIQRIVRLEHSLIDELEERPLVLVKGISAKNEILLLLNHATSNRLSRAALRDLANQKSSTVGMAIKKSLDEKETRTASNSDIVLTPIGQKYVFEDLLPKLRS